MSVSTLGEGMGFVRWRSSRLLIVAAGLVLGACAQDVSYRSARDLAPIPPKTLALMSDKGMEADAPILMRSFKKESEIEVWKRARDGKYALLKTYPICRWSGQLGPKMREGDRQAPEGFYAVSPASMNPKSTLFLSFNLGYPNAFDRAHGRSGAHLMVHGACSSRGCFAMTDEAMSEVYALARESFAGGQRSFQFQSLPFRMTAENLAKHRNDAHIQFWKNLKEGSDIFEVTGEEPEWKATAGRYAFNLDPASAAAVSAKASRDEQQVAALISKGTPSIRVVYEDGGGHPSLTALALAAANGESAAIDDKVRLSLGDVSRPEALASAPREIPVNASAPQPQLAAAPKAVAVERTAKIPARDHALAPPSTSLPKSQASAFAAPAPLPQTPALLGAEILGSSFDERFRPAFSK